MQIRDALPEEMDEAAAVLGAAYGEYAASMPPELWKGYRADIVDVRSRLHESELVVAEDEGRLAGTVTFYPPDDRDGRNAWPVDWAGIRLVAVHPDFRGKGVGRALTEECISRARAIGAPTVGLHTSSIMSVAMALYRRMGFVRMPERDFRPSPSIVVEAFRLDL
jgi:ribosomal protein S18 acetylase RimI-like enzyme